MPIDFDYKLIVSDSIAFSKKELGSAWTKLKPYAEHEFTQFAENAVFLAQLSLKGKIDKEELKLRLELQKMAMANVLLAIKGIGLVTAQNVVNGVIDIVAKAVKKSLGILLPV